MAGGSLAGREEVIRSVGSALTAGRVDFTQVVAPKRDVAFRDRSSKPSAAAGPLQHGIANGWGVCGSNAEACLGGG